jgi:hypothetical protein
MPFRISVPRLVARGKVAPLPWQAIPLGEADGSHPNKTGKARQERYRALARSEGESCADKR